MNVSTHLEDLSNEIFFEIFDYLHIFDIFTGFPLLNRRISSILQSIPLHIDIVPQHCRRQIDFLSSHLIFHEHQVISIDVSDTIRDDSSIISLLFNRHNFTNLQSFKVASFNSMTRLDNIIKQIGSLNTLVSVTIFPTADEDFNENNIDEFTRMILTHKSSSLRSIRFHYGYHHLDISNYTSLGSNLTSLSLRIAGTPSTVSVHSILRIFRLCHRIRYLCIVLYHVEPSGNDNNINGPSHLPPINENDLPILSQVMSFGLTITTICDIRSMSYILRCMPNLKHLSFLLLVQTPSWPFTDQYLNGYVWQQMFEVYLPCLSKFEFQMYITRRFPQLDLDFVVNSFNYFVNKYSNWDIIIDRWRYGPRLRHEFIMVCTSNYCKNKSTAIIGIPFLNCGTFETRSTRKTIDDHYSFYSDKTKLQLHIINERPNVTWSSPLFQHITHLVIEMPIIKSSWWNSFFNMIGFRRAIDDSYSAQQNLTYLSCFVHLPNVNKLEFRSMFHVDRWKDVQLILQACPNVTSLTINTPLLLLSKLVDNSFLVPIFKQIKMIKSITEKIYFPSNFALKLVQRFPLLSDIELQVFSFDNCVFIVEIFLSRLEHLSHLKIFHNQDTLLDNPFSCNYIITKRRQTFPINIINEQMVNVKNNGEVMEIWLS